MASDSDRNSVQRMSRSEYRRLRLSDYAGPKSSLLPTTQQRWPASHWALVLTGKGTCLVPVELDK